MRLLNYGTGEIVDRLTILSLKLLYGEQAGKEVKHFRDERNALLVKLTAGNHWSGIVIEHGLELAAVNAALWQAEDELREYRKQWMTEVDCDPTADHVVSAHNAELLRPVAYCAFRIQSLNDRRAQLISLINVNTGEARGVEKLT